MLLHGEHVTGAAKRRRERRLRSWLKHERQTVRMVLAETFHHSSAPFPPKFKEDWVGKHEQHAALQGQKTARTTVALEEEPGGCRQAPLPEVAAQQERLQRHTVEHVDVLPYMQIFDAPVPQVVDSAMDFFRRLDLAVAEQVIDVPTISSSLCPSRAVLREPQMAEQLVDVPIQHIVELLLRQWRSTRFSLRTGFGGRADHGHSNSGRGVQRGLQGFSQGRSSTARTMEQNVDIPVPGGGLHDLPVPGASSSAALSRDERGQRDFSHFSTEPNEVGHHLRALGRHCLRTRAHRRRQLMPCRWALRRRRRR